MSLIRGNSFADWSKSIRQSGSKLFDFISLTGGSAYNEVSDKLAMEAYLTSAALAQVVNTCSTAVAAMPYVLATEDANGDRTPITSGEYYDLIFNPNPDQTLQELDELQLLYYYLNGEAYEYFDRPVGMMQGRRISLPPSGVEVNTTKQGSILSEVTNYKFTDNGNTITIQPEDMLHMAMTNPTTSGRAKRNGLSPIQSAFHMVNASINTETFMSWYFENRGVSNIISGNGDPTKSLMPKDSSMIRRIVRSTFGGAHRGNGIEIVQNPITVNQLNASSTDMQTIDNYNLVVSRIAATYNLPAVLVQINENSTYNNVREAKKQAYYENFIPTANKRIRGYERTYLKQMTERTGVKHVMYVDTDKIEALQDDPNERKKILMDEVRIGAISRDEYRAETNREPIGSVEMNTPTIQSNLIPITEINQNEKG